MKLPTSSHAWASLIPPPRHTSNAGARIFTTTTLPSGSDNLHEDRHRPTQRPSQKTHSPRSQPPLLPHPSTRKPPLLATSDYSEDSATTAGGLLRCPGPYDCMSHAHVCARQRLHTLRERLLFIGVQFSILYTSVYSPAGTLLSLVARPKTAPRRQVLPLRVYVQRSCVCTSAVVLGGPHLRTEPDNGCRVP